MKLEFIPGTKKYLQCQQSFLFSRKQWETFNGLKLKTDRLWVKRATHCATPPIRVFIQKKKTKHNAAYLLLDTSLTYWKVICLKSVKIFWLSLSGVHIQWPWLLETVGVGHQVWIPVLVQGCRWIHWSCHWQCAGEEHQRWVMKPQFNHKVCLSL